MNGKLVHVKIETSRIPKAEITGEIMQDQPTYCTYQIHTGYYIPWYDTLYDVIRGSLGAICFVFLCPVRYPLRKELGLYG